MKEILFIFHFSTTFKNKNCWRIGFRSSCFFPISID